MDRTTFGKHDAAITLAIILQDYGDKKLQCKVSSCLHEYFKIMKEIDASKISNKTLILELIREKFLNIAEKIPHITPSILSYTRNTIIGKYKTLVRRFTNRKSKRFPDEHLQR